ncbi:hypothetical protein [Ureibacillus sinduriensis]|uniref:Beta-carotene 15,15'-monooxygenase n=1 Tax=Ureibacillus sinduriensis BLB-1 = JCM 15800 TaxID=1384057 RepID=A0A0A3HPT0_9BACL|nr:hypothetical protein [Ureibacillus sinduriensis]KGR74586.1 beta-carotene 15,15'-monooxygenase [Ureibacillus sinduriensis BLB-1 = JCM 15800]
MAILQKSGQTIWLVLMFVVLGSNMMLYHTAFGNDLLKGETNAVVIGSLIDLVIVAPLLFFLWKKQKSIKGFVLLTATGLIVARFLIPMEYLEPYAAVTWVGFALEAGVVFLELLLIVTLFKYLPKIVEMTRESKLPTIFGFSNAVDHFVKKHPLIHIICSEMLMFYYTFWSWRKKPNQYEHSITLHKNSSYIAFQIMLIHAILIETIGIHWWLHDKSVVLSLVLLFFNIYSVLFILADIQAVRLNPVHVDDNKLYLSLGLIKRMEIGWDEIEDILTDKEILKQKRTKDIIEFIARDFEEPIPDVILKLKKSKEATLIMGIKKPYQQVAIKFDHYQLFMNAVEKYKKF